LRGRARLRAGAAIGASAEAGRLGLIGGYSSNNKILHAAAAFYLRYLWR